MGYTGGVRIGFVLADLVSGSATLMWPSIASMFKDSGKDCLIVFAGGRIKGSAALDLTKNSVYRLVNGENVDSTIVWSSSLTGEVRAEEVLDYFSEMLGRPMVTIDGKTESHAEVPDVKFDAYEGSSFLVRHCIEEHGARRIAYIRGPEFHNSSMERYTAYLDELRGHGLEPDMRLVADPRPWAEGAESMRQLLDERGLVPGRDFDTLLCASDLMLFSASRVMAEHGYEIGRDVIACGFNDTLESKLLSVPVTTVRIPYDSLGVSAVNALMDVSRGLSAKDRLLPMVHLIRRSCGCHVAKDWERVHTGYDITGLVSDRLYLDRSEVMVLIDRVIRTQSEQHVREFLEFLCRGNADVYEIRNIIESFRRLDTLDSARKDTLVRRAWKLLPSILDRNTSMKSFQIRERSSKLNRFKSDLLSTNTVHEVAEVLIKHARDLGFRQIRLVLMEDNNAHLIEPDRVFPEYILAPLDEIDAMASGASGGNGCTGTKAASAQSGAHGVWVVAPLCTEVEYMGYVLMQIDEATANDCEEVSATVSSALRSALLFESTRRAQQAAEAAEMARTSFFANVSENLREPLSDISEIVASSDLEEGIKRSVIDRVTGANQIIDLALGSTGDLELNRRILNVGEILSGFREYNGRESLPCLLIDAERIGQVIEIVKAAMGGDVSISSYTIKRGVAIAIKDGSLGSLGSIGEGTDDLQSGCDCRGLWEEKKDDPGLQLARKIVLLHNGTCHVEPGLFSFTLPYPTLSGNPPIQWDGKILACLNHKADFEVQGTLSEEVDGTKFAEKKHLPSETGAIYWDISFNGYNALTSLMSLNSNETYRNLPFLVLNCPMAHTLQDSISSAIEKGGKAIVQIGTPAEDLYKWLQEPEFITCNIDEAMSTCKKHDPGLVIITIDEYSTKIPAVCNLLTELRKTRKNSQVPAIVVSDFIDQGLVQALGDIPNVVLVNSCMLESEEFAMRVRAILGGSELLPTHTAEIVKKAQAFLCTHATLPISRWQVADDVHVSEDYLTRVFKRELGTSPWDYLNRYRIYLAMSLLRKTGMSVNQVAEATGFQDQAYFCRVFKKIRGYNPSKLRSSKKSEMCKMQ